MNNEFFAKACGEWKDRLSEGLYTIIWDKVNYPLFYFWKKIKNHSIFFKTHCIMFVINLGMFLKNMLWKQTYFSKIKKRIKLTLCIICVAVYSGILYIICLLDIWRLVGTCHTKSWQLGYSQMSYFSLLFLLKISIGHYVLDLKNDRKFCPGLKNL